MVIFWLSPLGSDSSNSFHHRKRDKEQVQTCSVERIPLLYKATVKRRKSSCCVQLNAQKLAKYLAMWCTMPILPWLVQ